MASAWKLSDWNDIINRVNALATDPPSGCDPIDTVEEVEDPHLWSVQDILDVRAVLMQTCPDNTFTSPMQLWKQEIVDELEAAISGGWCVECKCFNDGYDEQTVLAEGSPGQIVGSGVESLQQLATDAGARAGTKTSEWSQKNKLRCLTSSRITSVYIPAVQAAQEMLDNAQTPQEVIEATQRLETANENLDTAQSLETQYQEEADQASEDADAAAVESQGYWVAAQNQYGVGPAVISAAIAIVMEWATKNTCEADGSENKSGQACRYMFYTSTKHLVLGPTPSYVFHSLGSGSYTPNGLPYCTARWHYFGLVPFVNIVINIVGYKTDVNVPPPPLP